MKNKPFHAFVIGSLSLALMGMPALRAASCPLPQAPAGAAIPADQARQQAALKYQEAGLAPGEAAARAAALTDAEALYVAEEAPALRRGGDGVVTVFFIVAIVAIVYMVFDYHKHHQRS